MTVARHYDVLLHRHASNPILTAADWPYAVHTVFNAGATQAPRRYDAAAVPGRGPERPVAPVRRAVGERGGRMGDRCRAHAPADPERYPEELWGIEDPRITFVPELGKYAIAYTAFGKAGPGVALALTEDFRSFERLGLVAQPEDKDAALLPRRVDGNFRAAAPPDDGWARRHLDLVLAGPAQLGWPR
jgi:predicted GH43/DUF377 family glycosyl hydrolase